MAWELGKMVKRWDVILCSMVIGLTWRIRTCFAQSLQELNIVGRTKRQTREDILLPQVEILRTLIDLWINFRALIFLWKPKIMFSKMTCDFTELPIADSSLLLPVPNNGFLRKIMEYMSSWLIQFYFWKAGCHSRPFSLGFPTTSTQLLR